MTFGLIAWAAVLRDGAAFIALILLATTSTVLCQTSLWKPRRPYETERGNFVPIRYVVIRGLQDAIVIFKCSESIADELFSNSANIFPYWAQGRMSQALVVPSTILMIVGIIMMSNATWTMQLALGVAYAVLHAVYGIWVMTSKATHWEMKYNF